MDALFASFGFWVFLSTSLEARGVFFIWMSRLLGINKGKTPKHQLILGYLVHPSFLVQGKSWLFCFIGEGVIFGSQLIGKGI